MSSGNISIFCPYCRCMELSSPEELCFHIDQDHKIPLAVHRKRFEHSSGFQNWLSSVEVARSDSGFLGSDVGPSCDDSEYYLLCRQRDSPLLKRRRLISPSKGRRQYDRINVVSCTAFVHVEYEDDGIINVLYCLDHCFNCDAGKSNSQNTYLHKRTKAKRSFECLSNDSTDTQTVPCCSVKQCEVVEVEDGTSEDMDNSSIDPDNCSNKNVDADEICYDISLMNKMITQRLDNTAHRLRVLTQLLADLAVDICACDTTKATVFI